MTATPTIRIQRDDFDVARETAAIRGQGADVGAIVTFTGLCRSEDDRLAALEIEHYPGMSEAEVTRIVGGGDSTVTCAGSDGHPSPRQDPRG
jgi:molybdopterin synthase catalytic subunit